MSPSPPRAVSRVSTGHAAVRRKADPFDAGQLAVESKLSMSKTMISSGPATGTGSQCG
jgi:hypothetical protein